MKQPWNGIERRSRQLAEQHSAELLMQSIPRTSPAGIGLVIDRVIQAVNPAMTTLTGYLAEELIGQSVHMLYPDEEAFAELAPTGGGVVETRWRRKDGGIVYILLSSAPIDPADLSLGLSFAALDISARKHLERQRLAEQEQQREVLVREVHHRIKNNLQSVAGLLRRELGKFTELDPHLDKAITQVHAIAVVHGLQSSDPDEAIRLCDTADQICKTVREQTQRPIEFRIEQTGFRPVQINRDEAVAVALILNELILNAVKHSPLGAPAPLVTLNADGVSAVVAIHNALGVDQVFNLDSGAGLKTGLNLVRALLPEKGASLDYAQNAGNLLATHLRLTAPVVQAISRKGA